MPVFELLSGIALGIFTNRLDAFIAEQLPRGHRLVLWKQTFTKKEVRVSIAYLYRILVDGKYLLVKSSRIDNQFQPVGGVRKYNSGAVSRFRELSVRNDDNLAIDDVSKDDLRVKVPAKNLLKLLDWYEQGHDRETDQQREFLEELVMPGILSVTTFPYIQSQYLYTVPTYHYSSHFRCWELLYHQVYEPIFTPQQLQAIRTLMNQPSSRYVWVSEDQILSLGHDKVTGRKPFQIGEHTQLLISKDHKLFHR